VRAQGASQARHASQFSIPEETEETGVLGVDDAKQIANRWRGQFADEAAFEASWSRYFETATVPDAGRLEAWLAKDQTKDAARRVGINSEPLLPIRQDLELSDCYHCGGKRHVRKDVELGHPDFGKAFACPNCNGGSLREVLSR
jgi:hypothetical protein